MAHHRAGHAEEAKKWLDKATAWTDKALSQHETQTGRRLSFADRTMLRLLRAEAEAMIKGPAGQQPKTVSEGKEKTR
jgi:hypothetical protein